MSSSQIPRTNRHSKGRQAGVGSAAFPSPQLDPSLRVEGNSPGYAHTEAQSLCPPSPLLDDGASDSMETCPVTPNSAPNYADPEQRSRFRDRSRTPLGLHSQNRRSAVFNQSIHQDLAGIDLPKQAAMNDLLEPQLLSNLNKLEDCCRFIRDIRRFALEEGLSDDKKWIAEYAATRFEGDAMIWHVELDDHIKSNWDKLELAILERARGANTNPPTAFRRRLASNHSTSTTSSTRYSRSRSGSQNSAFMQGPDAPLFDSPLSDGSYASTPYTMMGGSPRARSASSHSSKPSSTFSLPKHGRLLLKDYTGEVHYVGLSVNIAGHFKRTSEQHEALLVKVERSQGKIYLQNSSSRGRTLGITWDINKDCTPHLGKGSKDRAYLVYIDHNGKSSAQGWTWTGPSKDSIWTVNADNSVHPIWIDENGGQHELQIVVKAESLRMWHLDTISLVTDAEAFMKDHSDYMRSYLVFEPQV